MPMGRMGAWVRMDGVKFLNSCDASRVSIPKACYQLECNTNTLPPDPDNDYMY